jgi:diacylglycerol kinase (ATP)
MQKHKVKLIVNPNADLGRAWQWASNLRPVVEEFGGADWSGTVYPTHAIDLAGQAAAEGYDLIIAVGGDGTIHEVINGLMQVPAERRPRLGVVPVGTGNDFAHNIGMKTRPEFAMRQIFTGQPKKVDLAMVEDGRGRREYFDNTMGIGFDATVNIRSRNIPFVRGFLVYFVSVIQTIILNHEAPRMQVTTDRESWDENNLLLVLCNGPREGGGFYVAPEARIDDGVLNYVRITKVSRPLMLRLVPEVMKGTHGRFSQVRMGTFNKLLLKSDRPLYIHADGEIFAGFGTDVRNLSVEICPGAIEVLA